MRLKTSHSQPENCLSTALLHRNTLETNGKRSLQFGLACLILLSATPLRANSGSDGNPANVGSTLFLLDTFSGNTPLQNGVQVHGRGAVIQAEALRDDVIRIRIARDGNLPEDSSWAVLPAARSEHVDVTAEDDGKAVGFRTKLLRLRIDRKTLRLSLTDLKEHVLQEDAPGWPVEFHGQSFRIYKQMPREEHYFGLGDKIGPLDRRGQSFTLWNTDSYNFQESTDPLYKSIPFFLAMREGRALGVLMDNTWRSSFDFGKETSKVYSFGAEDGPIDYYLLYGPDAKHVLTTYAWLTGPTPLPPLWTLGYQQSRYSYGSESELREIAARLRADHIPADALYLDIDYQENNRPFTVDSAKFPNFSKMLSDLRKQDFHVVGITDLHIANLPRAGYAPYDTGIAGDRFVKNPDGSIYVARVWPGASVFPDFTQQTTRKWWGELYKPLVAEGLSGFWNDMNEPSVFDGPDGTMPVDIEHRIDEIGFQKRTASHREIHNVYGMENSRATYEGLLNILPNQRPFVLTRATYAGGQRYAATWTGDDSSTWNHLRLTTPMLLNLGLSGFGLSGADVGGFIGTPSPELLTKWTELGTFQPIDRNHSEKGTGHREPWVHGPEQEAIRRRFIEERYKLLPYLYAAAEEMSRTGVPMMRPLFLEFSNPVPDGHPLDLDAGNEFMLGRSILVAPPPYPEKSDEYKVLLPSGHWYNYWTGDLVRAQTNATSSEDPPGFFPEVPRLDTLPVFVREGSILPLQPVIQSTSELPKGPLMLRVYPGTNCQGSLYQDDGATMAYQRGEFLRMQFSCEQTATSLKLHVGPHEGTYKPWWKELQVEVYGMSSGSHRVLGTGGSHLKTIADSQHHSISFAIADDGRGADLELTLGHE